MSRGQVEETRAVNRRLDSIQIMRGIAALLVVVSHTADRVIDNEDRVGVLHAERFVDHIDDFGAIGVDLFFIISGFVMALSVRRLSGARGAGQFLALRWARIAPPYIIVTVVLSGLLLAFGDQFQPSWHGYFNAFLFVPLADADGYTTPPLDIGWTLSFEFTFYLAVAAMIVLGAARRLEILAGVICAVAVIGMVADPQPYILSWLTNPILLEFALGIVAYRLWDAGLLGRARVVQWVLAAAAVVVLAVQLVVGFGDVSEASTTLDASSSALRVLQWGLPLFFIFVAALPLAPVVSSRLGAAALHLGNASYSVYLVHIVVLIFVGNALQRSPVGGVADVAFVMGIVASTAAGLAFYRWVEDPLTKRTRAVVAGRLHSTTHLPA